MWRSVIANLGRMPQRVDTTKVTSLRNITTAIVICAHLRNWEYCYCPIAQSKPCLYRQTWKEWNRQMFFCRVEWKPKFVSEEFNRASRAKKSNTLRAIRKVFNKNVHWRFVICYKLCHHPTVQCLGIDKAKAVSKGR